MLCPECKIEARISNKAYVIKGEKLFIRYEYSCRNQKCTQFDKQIGAEDDEVTNFIVEEATKEPTEKPAEEPTEEPVEESVEETEVEESTNTIDEEASE